MPGVLEIIPLPSSVSESGYRRQCMLLRRDTNGGEEASHLWIDLPLYLEGGDDPRDCDPFLMMALLEAMRENLSLRIQGTVDQELISNLTEFQRYWKCCRPSAFREIAVEVEQLSVKAPSGDQAICTFTGGLDSSFTAWRHSQNLNGYRNRPLSLACMIHGADIPLENRSGFSSAFRKACETLQTVGIELAPVRTNFREISRVSWEVSHGIVIAAVLSCFQSRAGIGLIASGKPYGNLRACWGSSPITDPLLSSGYFRIIHDGADHDRTEKAAALLGWPMALQNLRVCWEGAEGDRNCGHCHKCVLTKLNFLAAGSDIPAAFPPSDILSDIRSLVLPKGTDNRKELELLFSHVSVEERTTTPWIKALSTRLFAESPAASLPMEEARSRGWARRAWRRVLRTLRPHAHEVA